MKNLFITGMGRSGTTLLEKLLTNHKDIDVISQPLPLIFVEVKRQFLKTKGLKQYYVLNDDTVSRDYPDSDLNAYLTDVSMSDSQIDIVFQHMKRYSGQVTKRDFSRANDTRVFHGFAEIIKKCLTNFEIKPEATFLGFKEIMCEEFVPYLCENRYKCIVIIRDPRDVLASANYPLGKKYFGKKRPSLFILRSWRKSVEYTYSMRNHKDFMFLRYEDLVSKPFSELRKITTFLGVEKMAENSFEKGISDRDGKVWQANSSFGNDGSFISQKSKGVFMEALSTEEIQFTEAVCKYEMDWLGYSREFEINNVRSIASFRDIGVEGDDHLAADFSSQPMNIAAEIERYNSSSVLYIK